MKLKKNNGIELNLNVSLVIDLKKMARDGKKGASVKCPAPAIEAIKLHLTR